MVVVAISAWPSRGSNGRKRQRRAIQPVGCWVKECLRKRVAQVVRAERGRKRGFLTQFGNNLPNAAFSQRPALTEEEMPIWPATPGGNGFSPDGCPLAPLFSQTFTIGEIRIEWFACLPSPAE